MRLKLLFAAFSLALFAACSQGGQKTAEPSQTETTVKPVEIVYHVEGMTCDHCEESIQKGVGELEGIDLVESNHEDSTTKVVYDPSKTDEKAIIAAIEKRGYTVAQAVTN